MRKCLRLKNNSLFYPRFSKYEHYLYASESQIISRSKKEGCFFERSSKKISFTIMRVIRIPEIILLLQIEIIR